jgi:hypothetical protein
MDQVVSKSSLRKEVLTSVEAFLYKEGFKRCDITQIGILDLIDKIADYYEEGTCLFPEIIVTNNFEFFKSIPCKVLPVRECELTSDEFSQVLKLCAPLATNNWVIYIEVNKPKMRYGLINAEIADNSPSLYDQTVGTLKENIDSITLAYLRNVGQKTVELVGLRERNLISFTLKDFDFDGDTINKLTRMFVKNITLISETDIGAANKHLLNTLRESHGALIGIVENVPKEIRKLIKGIPDGVYLTDAVALVDSIVLAGKEKSSDLSISLRNELALLAGMINQDGITVFSTDGKILAYHLFIKQSKESDTDVVGGARKRAFFAMQKSGLFKACLMKSQEGKIDYWSKDE